VVEQRQGGVIKLPDYITPEQFETTKAMMLNQDPPAHTRLRKLVSRLFTPRSVESMQQRLTGVAREVVSEAAASGAGDFVEQVASRLPVEAIADLIGIPAHDREEFFHWTNSIINSDDPDSEDPAIANAKILGYAYTMAEERRRDPKDDIVTRLVHADVDGESLDELEFGFFVVLLATAGNETTRNAIAFGMEEFFARPDQWELYVRSRPLTAVDEIVRWSTPVQVFQRTATRDTEIDGMKIAKGQRVGLFYGSANYDEDVFDRPFEFDITRDPNPHLGFGGSGTHHCIGANLARMEIDLMFNAIADIVPAITKAGELQCIRSGFINGAKHLPVRYRTTTA
jgi:cholest-4-en-3-one 26-monooxygenase